MYTKLATLIIAFCLSFLASNAQTQDPDSKTFIDFLAANLKMSEFADSSALYTCKLSVTFDRKKPLETTITSNNPLVSNKIEGIDNIKNFNFKPWMGKNRRMIFHIPIVVIVSDSSKEKQCIEPHLISDKIVMLFAEHGKYLPNSGSITMFPLITLLDKKEYY